MVQQPILLRNSLLNITGFIAFLWIIKWLEWTAHLDLGFLGILPRTLSGTMGIITAPLIHGDWLHLISNTFPLLLLGVSVFYFHHKIAAEVFGWIYFMSGFWVWMAARDAYHIGASGLVYGLVAFLFFSGIFRRDLRSLTISLLVVFLYGGMVQGIFPGNEQISWESHFLGALAGLFCAFFYKGEYSPLSSTEPLLASVVQVKPTYSQLQQQADLYALKNNFLPNKVVGKPVMEVEFKATPAVVEFIRQPNRHEGLTGPAVWNPFSRPTFTQTGIRLRSETIEEKSAIIKPIRPPKIKGVSLGGALS